MAAQCRSPRCTAERKGFRRELDSWRHRLIHCVGFESILEGLYGPGLRRDLSLFDDCEPEELVDWGVDEKCSLCSLRKETVDCTQSGGSAQSSPTGEVISQGQFNTEKIECQAENYLNALFQKKDLPQNCDPNIPLVAQELMKKMIRQFAIEYVSKSRKMYRDNGTKVDSPRGCNGIQLNQKESVNQEDQDGPLDLTVTRIQEDSFQDEDGVLDLSVKRNGSGLDEKSKIKNLKLDVKNGYFLRKLKNATKRPKESTALTKVLATYCLHHRQQLVLMLKFLREEQKTCSQICCDNLQISEQADSTKKTKITPAMFYSCTKEKPSNCVSLKKQVSSANLPYLSVRLKDLRLTWPNLALGTVKLNPIKHEDLHLRSNDQVLHCINTRSKKKKLFIHCSSRYRAISCSSSLPRLKLQRVTTCLDGAVSKCHLKYCNQAASPVSIKNKSCQTERTHKTVTKSPYTKDPSCDVNGKQKNLMLADKNATSPSFRDKCKLGSVHFGNLIKHLLNNSKTNHFVELLNQDTNNLENTGIQTRLRKSQQKSPMIGCSLSSSQSLEFTSKLNFCDAFPKEKNSYDRDSRNSDENMAISAKEQNVGNILNMEDPKNTPTESATRERKTKLPHSKSKIHSKNVDCVKNSQPCLPEGSTFSAVESVNKHKRRSRRDSFVQCNIPFKRYSKNILGKCKLCDVSHGQCSVPSNNNLFCKCTIKHNSGIFKNFKIDRLVGRNTTDKTKNAHLKIVVERLENTICSGAHNSERSKKGNWETRKNISDQGKERLSTNQPISARSNNHLSLRSSTQKNQGDSALSPTSVSYNSPSCGISVNMYLSPIKLMFVSKIESEDGVKYALSPVYTPFNNSDHQSLAALGKQSNDAQKSNAMSDDPRQSGNPNNFLNPQREIITSSSPSEACKTTQNHQEDADMVGRKWLGSIRVGYQSFRNVRNSAVKQLRSNNLDKEMPVEMKKNDLKISIPCKASVTNPKMADRLRESRITETYIAKNISSTQIKIQKLHRTPDSPVASGFTTVGLTEDHTMPLERESCKISLRLSARLQKLANPYTVPNLRLVNESSSEQEKLKNKAKSLSDVQQENSKKANNLENCQAEQNRNQKTKLGKRKILKSRLIRKQTLSNYMTRSKKSPLFALYCGSQPTFSVRRALLHKSKKRSFVKNKHYRKKLRSYQQQCKPSIIHLNRVDNEDTSPCISKYPDLQANPAIEWWSTTTSHETLLNHLEGRYEHIAKTWVTDNNVEKACETQSLPSWKFSGSESRSSIQMLFQKQCDMNDLATWFMQTTETQSLEIVRKKPLHVTGKGSRKKTKQPSINSSKNHLKKCSQLTESSTLEEPRVSKFVLPQSFSLNTRKHKRKNNPEMNSLQCSSDQTKDVCVKFSCPGETSDLTKFCTVKVTNALESTVEKSVQVTKDGLQDSHSDSRSPISSKPHIKALRENEPRRSTRRRSNKLDNTDYNAYLPKCGYKKTKMLPLNKVSSDGNNYTVKSGLGLNAGFGTKYRLQLGKTLAKHQHMNKMNKLKRRYEMCLRNLRGTVVKCDRRCSTSILEERKKHMKVAFYLEQNNIRPKELRPITGKMHTEYTKFHIGPLKPVGFPATRGLISKFGSYSLTPIRIPLK